MSKKFFSTTVPRTISLEVLLIIAIAIAIAMRFLNLGTREFWYDEVLSVLFASVQKGAYQTPGDVPVALSSFSSLFSLPVESTPQAIIGTFRTFFNSIKGDVHPPLSYLGLHFWLRLFGNSEAALRSLMALVSVGAVGSAYGLGRRLLGHRGGLILAALLAVNPFYLSHALNIRMYSPLVLWTILSAWAMLEVVELRSKDKEEIYQSPVVGAGLDSKSNLQPITSKQNPPVHQSPIPIQNPKSKIQNSSPNTRLRWSVVLVTSIAAGLLTQYLFFYWVLTLLIFSLVLNRQRWWQHGLCLGAGVLLAVPWFLWGTRQQLRNRGESISQVAGEETLPFLRHLQDVAQTLGAHLLLGDWVTSIPKTLPTVAGCVAIALLLAITLHLWKRGEDRALKVALLLGIVPLMLPLAVDILTNKFTVNFGWGRAMIFILPGCLLLIALWLERVSGRWQGIVVTGLLLLYLTISIGDLSLRPRWMFHQMADLIQQQPNTPTLIVMNSKAWGHVLRLAYYLPNTAPVKLLAQSPADVAPTLSKVLADTPSSSYAQILWLESANPVWGSLKTDVEKENARQKIQAVLNSNFKLQKTQQLLGTMNMDDFTVKVYTRSKPS